MPHRRPWRTARILLLGLFGGVGAGLGASAAAQQPGGAERAQLCRLDWNHDGRGDLAVFAPSGDRTSGDGASDDQEYELVVMYENEAGYAWERLSESAPWDDPALSCKTGDTVTETVAGPGDAAPRTFDTGGSYVEIAQAEGAAVAYFWDGEVREVWTAD